MRAIEWLEPFHSQSLFQAVLLLQAKLLLQGLDQPCPFASDPECGKGRNH